MHDEHLISANIYNELSKYATIIAFDSFLDDALRAVISSNKKTFAPRDGDGNLKELSPEVKARLKTLAIVEAKKMALRLQFDSLIRNNRHVLDIINITYESNS